MAKNGNGKHVPDDWQTEILVCPDESCEHVLLRAERIKGKPRCMAPIHKRTGHYPMMDRLVVGIEERR